MSGDQALNLLTQLIWTSAIVVTPLMAATLIVGLAISVLQVATQLQESTLTYVPKLLAAAAVLIIASPWMMSTITAFARQTFQLIPALG